MKVLIKKTGEIVNAASYAKVALDMCDSYGNPIEVLLDEIELLQDGDLSLYERIDILKDIIANLTSRIDGITQSQINHNHRLEDIETQLMNQENGNAEENN